MAQWFVARDGKQQGPVSQAGLVQAIGRGKVRPTDLVWNETLPAWVPLGDVPELAMGLPGQPETAQGVAAADDAAAETDPAPAEPEYAHADDAAVPVASASAAPVAQLGYQSSVNRGATIVFTDRAINMLRQTRPWVVFLSVLLFIVVGFGFVGIVITLIAQLSLLNAAGAGPGGGMIMLIGTAVQAAVLLLYILPAMYLWRYGARIGQFLSARREDLAEQALEAQKSFWKFVGIIALISIAVALASIAVVTVIATMALR